MTDDVTGDWCKQQDAWRLQGCEEVKQVAERGLALSSPARQRGLLVGEKPREKQIPRRLRLLGMTEMEFFSNLNRAVTARGRGKRDRGLKKFGRKDCGENFGSPKGWWKNGEGKRRAVREYSEEAA
ncbi:MAG: hypothetical protein LAN71_14720 [Acidobacteriia bacterium]|nr:hypothetical protein [Terriglobia bacterium]